MKNVEIGKFYFLHDGSKTGHPCFVISKDDDSNRYLVVRFDSDKYGEKTKSEKGVRHITMLSAPTSEEVLHSYVHNRPMLCKRKDIGIELDNLHLNDQDKKIIEEVSKRNIELSPSLKK